MPVSRRHLLRQRAVIAALGRTAAHAIGQNFGLGSSSKLTPPGPELTQTVAPRAPELIKDYIKVCGGDPSWYKGTVPPGMFPQWCFPLLGQTLLSLPYPLGKVLNGGCAIEVRGPIPAGEPLELRARIADIDDDGYRAIITQEVITGGASAPDALKATLTAFVPIKRREGEKKKKEKARVPDTAREIGRFKAKVDLGMDFALVTGDFNPVHWVRPYAKAAGFKNTILHGFATMGRAIETLNRARYCGDPAQLGQLEVRFTKPLVLPAQPGIYINDETPEGAELFVGTAPGGPAFMTGRFGDRNGEQP